MRVLNAFNMRSRDIFIKVLQRNQRLKRRVTLINRTLSKKLTNFGRTFDVRFPNIFMNYVATRSMIKN